MNTTKELINAALDDLVQNQQHIQPAIWRIKIDGEFIVTPSGKSSWKKINHAKSALRNALEPSANKIQSIIRKSNGFNWHTAVEEYDKVYLEILKERVEFIQI